MPKEVALLSSNWINYLYFRQIPRITYAWSNITRPPRAVFNKMNKRKKPFKRGIYPWLIQVKKGLNQSLPMPLSQEREKPTQRITTQENRPIAKQLKLGLWLNLPWPCHIPQAWGCGNADRQLLLGSNWHSEAAAKSNTHKGLNDTTVL